jgi:hypothetical protein
MACHFNPFGNGPLTDYGRVVSATEIADRFNWDDKYSEDEIAERSGFLMSDQGPSVLHPSISYRGLFVSPASSTENVDFKYITMDLSASIAATLLSQERLILLGNIAYAPTPRLLESSNYDVKNYRSRELYAGYRISKNLGIYAGLMDKVFGIRTANHTAYSRTLTGLTQNDQTYGLILHYVDTNLEFGIQPFIGNLVQKLPLRQQGLTIQSEFSVIPSVRIGISALSSHSEFLHTKMAAIHLRSGLGKGHSIVTELGQVSKSMKMNTMSKQSQYLLTETQIRLRRGTWFLFSAEAMRAEVNSLDHTVRYSPGIQWIPVQRLEFRTDARFTKAQLGGQDTPMSIDLICQLHLWL